MSTGRQRHDWEQTAALLALLANAHRDPRRQRRPATPADFMPPRLLPGGQRRPPGQISLANGGLHLLKQLFVKAANQCPAN